MNKKNETPEMLKVQVHDLVPTGRLSFHITRMFLLHG